MIEGYISAADNGFELISEPNLRTGSGSKLIPDLIVSLNNKKIIVEVKRINNPVNIKLGIEQLTSYMNASDILEGVLFIPPYINKREIKIDIQDHKIGNKDATIIVVTGTDDSAID